MIVLSYGFKQPQNGDASSVWFPALAENVTLLNNHTHDGSNSSFLNAGSIAPASVDILAVNWTLVSTGIYTQTVTTPLEVNLDDNIMQIKLSTGEFVYPSITRLTPTSFSIRTNDNSLDYVAVFR
jgi:hypothetical protein